MRTTVDLDEDVLIVVRHLAAEREQSVGRVLSDLIRQALQPKTLLVQQRTIPTLPRHHPGGEGIVGIRSVISSQLDVNGLIALVDSDLVGH